MSVFTDFMGWARAYVAQHSLEDLRLAWRASGRNVANIRLCSSCDESAIVENNTSAREAGLTSNSGLACRCCEACETCCDCTYCEGCRRNRSSDDICSQCNYCTNSGNCCECTFCPRCDAECHDNYCHECERCGDCCTCEEEENIFFDNPLKFHDATAEQFKMNASKRYIAAEIEILKIDTDAQDSVKAAVDKWSGSIVHDGSLPNGGFEINTAPANGDVFVKQIAEVCDRLGGAGASVDKRCGLHVHIDARDYSFYDIRRLVRVYAKIESALFSMVPESRKTGTYCVPCGHKYVLATGEQPLNKLEADVNRALYGNENPPAYVKTDKYHPARYNALNIHSWFFRGTIECRMFNGTKDASKITSWGIMWAQILDYCKAHTDAEVDAELADGSPLACLMKIAGKHVLTNMFVKERVREHGTVEMKTELEAA